ncbi:hypothetical protein [Photobacterium kasasachensis]|uniref:hypothetical protein n=1 Tax=Photobacterium kasasachensis TaxID=2910240 RepID=UPI003D0A1DFC
MVAYYVVRKEEKQIYLVAGMEMNLPLFAWLVFVVLGAERNRACTLARPWIVTG